MPEASPGAERRFTRPALPRLVRERARQTCFPLRPRCRSRLETRPRRLAPQKSSILRLNRCLFRAQAARSLPGPLRSVEPRRHGKRPTGEPFRLQRPQPAASVLAASEARSRRPFSSHMDNELEYGLEVYVAEDVGGKTKSLTTQSPSSAVTPSEPASASTPHQGSRARSPREAREPRWRQDSDRREYSQSRYHDRDDRRTSESRSRQSTQSVPRSYGEPPQSDSAYRKNVATKPYMRQATPAPVEEKPSPALFYRPQGHAQPPVISRGTARPAAEQSRTSQPRTTAAKPAFAQALTRVSHDKRCVRAVLSALAACHQRSLDEARQGGGAVSFGSGTTGAMDVFAVRCRMGAQRALSVRPEAQV